MKKWKKWLSAGLAACILFSTLSASALAGTTERQTGLSTAEEAASVLAQNKANINAPAPVVPENKEDPNYDKQKEALENYLTKLGLYDRATALYKALNEAEKNAFDLQTALTLIKNTVEHEAYLIKTAYDSKLPSDAPAADKMSVIESRRQAQEKLNGVLGPHKVRDEAVTLGKHLSEPYKDNLKLNGNTKFDAPEAVYALNKYKKAYGEASELCRKYLDGYNATFLSMSSNGIGTQYRDLVKMIANCALAENPYPVEKPERAPSKPNAKNYPLGVNDPDYLAAIQEWLPKKEKTLKFDCDSYNYTAELNSRAMDEISTLAPEYAEMSRVLRALRDSYRTFIEEKTTNDVKDAMKAFDELEPYYQTVSRIGVNAYSYYWLNDSKDDFRYNNLSFSQLYKVCEETGGTALLDEFVAFIDSIDLNAVTNDIVKESKAKYKVIPAALKQLAPSEIMEKYEKILAKYKPVQPIKPSEYRFEKELAAYRPTSLTYPEGLPKEDMRELLAALEAMVPELLNTIPEIGSMGGLQNIPARGVYTNAALTQILTLYHTLETTDLVVDAMGMSLNIGSIVGEISAPQKMSDYLSEQKFAGAKAKIDAVIKSGATTTEGYVGLQFENGDWGFEDGDRDGFANALAACLRPVGNLLLNGWSVVGQILLLPNSVNADGDYIYGAYESLIPLLEGLGLQNVLSSEEYSNRFYEAAKVSPGAQLDSMLLPIIQPVLGLLDRIAANPVETLLTLLPNLAKLVNDGILNDCVNSALHTSSLLGGMTVDLSGDALSTMLTGLLGHLQVDDTTALTLTLSPVDWDALAGCGKAVLMESASASNAYRVAVEADTTDVFLLVYRYVFDNLIGNSANRQQISILLSKLLPEYSAAIGGLLSFAAQMGPDELLVMLKGFFITDGTTEDPEEPNPAPKPQPVSPGEIPKTGDTSLAVMSAAALISAGLYLATRRKER